MRIELITLATYFRHPRTPEFESDSESAAIQIDHGVARNVVFVLCGYGRCSAGLAGLGDAHTKLVIEDLVART